MTVVKGKIILAKEGYCRFAECREEEKVTRHSQSSDLKTYSLKLYLINMFNHLSDI